MMNFILQIAIILIVFTSICNAQLNVNSGNIDIYSAPAHGDIVMKPDVSVQIQDFKVNLGAQKTLMPNGALGLQYFPDEGIVVLRQKPTFEALVTAAIRTYKISGPSIGNITQAKVVLDTVLADTAINGYIGASAGFRHPNGTLYAFCHAEDHVGLPWIIDSIIPGFDARVVLAGSQDNGGHWKYFGPIITSYWPKDSLAYPDQKDFGAGEPGCVVDKSGKYVYLYYTEHSRIGRRGVQICMARAKLDKSIPGRGKWTKYYNGSFCEPGIAGRDTPVMSAYDDIDSAEALSAHVEYSRLIDKYIMIVGINYWREYERDLGLKNSGLYISMSDDAVHWEKPVKLITDFVVPLQNRSLSWVGTLVLDSSRACTGMLVYGYSPNWNPPHLHNGTPHYMVGRRLWINRIRETKMQ